MKAGVALVAILTASAGALVYVSMNGMPATVSNALSGVNSGLNLASSGGLAQVEVNGVGLIADTFTGTQPLAPICSLSSKNSYLELLNSGPGGGTAQSVTITYGGADNVFTISGRCAVGPAGSQNSTIFILFGGPSKLPNSLPPQSSSPYVGSVTLSNGAKLPFSGRFSQGYPSLSMSSVSIAAANLGAGQPGNATCSTTPNPAKPYIAIVNAGTVGDSFARVTITWKGTANVFPVSGSCSVGPDGTSSSTIYIMLDGKLSSAAEAGQSFSGTVAPTFGAAIPFTGTFQ